MKFKIALLASLLITGCIYIIKHSNLNNSTSGQDNCDTADSQQEINLCGFKKVETTKTRLNTLVSELKYHMNEGQYINLLEMEKDWESLIVRECEWQNALRDGGSIKPTLMADCLNNQYLHRIDTLRLLLCEGHGLTGECEDSRRYKE